MSIVMSNRIRGLVVYLLICFLTFTLGAMVIELAIDPLIAWLHGYKRYYLPDLNRIYAWLKFIPFASIVCGGGAWLYDKRRLGR